MSTYGMKLEKWFPLQGERAHSLYFGVFKNKIDNDNIDKKVCQGCIVSLLLRYSYISLSAEFYLLIPNHHKGGAIMTEGD